jgi:hypothetical protein
VGIVASGSESRWTTAAGAWLNPRAWPAEAGWDNGIDPRGTDGQWRGVDIRRDNLDRARHRGNQGAAHRVEKKAAQEARPQPIQGRMEFHHVLGR